MSFYRYILSVQLVLIFFIATKAAKVKEPIFTLSDAAAYLYQYQYVNIYLNYSLGMPHDVYKEGLIRFQNYSKLKVTGLLDSQTIKLMKLPRCLVPDLPDYKKWFRDEEIMNGVWGTKKWTYRIVNYPSYFFSKDKKASRKKRVDDIIKRAFRAWADVSACRNFKCARHGEVNVTLKFVGGTPELIRKKNFLMLEDDTLVTDGKNGFISLSLYPGPGNKIIFDDSELWADYTDDKTDHINLYSVALHQVGHTIGLRHSLGNQAEVMSPFYQGKTELHENDIIGAQRLYGERRK